MQPLVKTSFLENVDLCFNRAAKALELPKGAALGRFEPVMRFAR